MKKRILTLFSIALMGCGMQACNDALEIENTQNLSDLAVWSTESAAEMYITAVYKTFTDVSQVANSRNQYFDSYSDLMKSTSWDQYSHGYNKALLQSSAFVVGSAGPLDAWSSVYSDRIRRANVLLDDIKRYGVSKFGEEWCDIRRAEARLCRAFSYYRLIRVYGGVVLRTDVSGASGGVDDGANASDVHRARATEAESWDYVLKELQWSAEHLPESWPSAWEGRATKKTAYGLLSRMALHAKEWQIAVDAAEKVKQLGGRLAADYSKVFQVDGGQDNTGEILFKLNFLSGSVMHNYDKYNRPFGDKDVHSTDVYAEHVPTAELADLYEFKDGTNFSWTTYGNTHADPYTDREPRFHATILYNGAKWENRTIETFVGGADGFQAFTQAGATAGHTCTGYYLRKYLQEGNADFVTQGSSQYDAVLRYAEVLLNKAEAYAELDFGGYRSQALDALNEVRNRVGLPSRTPADTPTKEVFMEYLRKERAVELAGEGLRYWDLRRWKRAEAVINGKNAHGTKITKAANGSLSYETVAVDGGSPRIFLTKYYYFSLPTAETANNNLADNNPNW
ncbi:RagB/SusD family nutrient uptake outer membrane protein [Sphingobacterium sp. SYP-B4668]|uniref:RagB/SusD family nutrient uptake outer membrane protein n=1 Tax=Sphingobacterium sp. SYP-B4668 TaxID=2996035 RepID=UPI0022DDE6D7|nr:RagB/SusD family nutrient uptake outer membrane protein [Sphingobacterium sp. SYP-B4668]